MQTNSQLQDEQDQTAISEQVGHCGLEKGQFISVNRWPFKLDIECCWGLRFINVHARPGLN